MGTAEGVGRVCKSHGPEKGTVRTKLSWKEMPIRLTWLT